MQMNGLLSGLYTFTEWMMRLAWTNILWMIFNIPIIFFGLNLLIGETTNQLIFTIIIMIVLLPFFFFPATTAMFAVVRKWAMGQSDIHIMSSFWKYYKENYVRSVLGGIILVALWAIFFLDYYYFIHIVNDILKYIFYGLFIFLFMFTIHFFSNTVHFYTNLINTLKNALFMTLKNPLLSLITTLVNVLIIMISFKIALFLIPFFMGALVAIISFIGFYRVSLKTPFHNS